MEFMSECWFTAFKGEARPFFKLMYFQRKLLKKLFKRKKKVDIIILNIPRIQCLS